jgi:hypothetical protein
MTEPPKQPRQKVVFGLQPLEEGGWPNVLDEEREKHRKRFVPCILRAYSFSGGACSKLSAPQQQYQSLVWQAAGCPLSPSRCFSRIHYKQLAAWCFSE